MDGNLKDAMEKMQREREALINRRHHITKRLRPYRTALLKQSQGALSSRHATNDLGKQRRELCHVRDLLEHGEKEMIRRWSKHRSIVTACMIMLTLLALSASSFYAATTITSPVWGVSMVVQIPQDHWQHRMSSNAVLQQVINRHHNVASNVGELKRHLASSLLLEQGPDDQLTVAIETSNPDKALALLIALGESVTSVTVPSGPFVNISVKPHMTTLPMRSAMPLRDNRYDLAGRIFAVLVCATMLLTMCCRYVLGRERRVFNKQMRKLMSVLNQDELSTHLIDV